MSNAYIPPNNVEAEEAIIGSALIDPSIFTIADVRKLKPDDFYIIKNGMIWEACLAEADHLDILTLNTRLTNMGVLAEVGGSAYLAGIISNTPTSMNAKSYANIIAELAVRRRDIHIGQELIRRSYEGDIDRARFIDMLSKNEPVEGGTESIDRALNDLIKMVEERAKDPKDIWGIPTKFIDIDKKIGGLQPEQTLMLAATAGKGKSVLAMQIAKNVAEQGIGVAIYSFEMSAVRVLMRLLSGESGIPTRAMNTGRMDKHWDDFYGAVDKMSKLPIYMADIFGMESSMLRADLSSLKAKHDIRLIVVDYLNKLLDNDGGSELENTKLKARRMQSVCREFGVAGVLIQSMNKEGMRSDVPVMADMSGPADVAHEGDVVFLMGNHPDNDTLMNLYPAKMRDGDTSHAPITLKWAEGVPKFVNYVGGETVKLEWFHD